MNIKDISTLAPNCEGLWWFINVLPHECLVIREEAVSSGNGKVFFLSFFFCHTKLLAGSQFPNQESNVGHDNKSSES